jgi:hypothetical protein
MSTEELRQFTVGTLPHSLILHQKFHTLFMLQNFGASYMANPFTQEVYQKGNVHINHMREFRYSIILTLGQENFIPRFHSIA